MDNSINQRIRENPKFQELVARRGRFAWSLALTVIVIFYSFVMLVAFSPAVLGQRVAEGSALTVGVALGASMFVFFWLLTAVYVWRANTRFDALTNEIVTSAVKGGARHG